MSERGSRFMDDFQSFLESSGYSVDDIKLDGKIHRFRLPGKKAPDGWYVYHDAIVPYGSCGDWVSGETYKWTGHNGDKILSKADRETIEKQRRCQRTSQRKRHELACNRAERIWVKAKPADPMHPYLARKRVKPYGLRQAADGRLIVPAYGADGKIQTLQFIDADGQKRFLTGGKKAGACFSIKGNDRFFLCEGYATAASIHEATGGTVIVSFDAGNLLLVAVAFRKKHHDIPLTVCADNDQWTEKNPGMSKARAAAEKIGRAVAVVFPTFKDTSTRPTDFNDLYILEGADAVCQQISMVGSIEINDGPECTEKPRSVFPYEVVSGAAGFFSQLYSEYLESPPEFFYFSYLTCLGSVLSRSVTLSSELQPQPRLYILLLGQSADERKSTALSKAANFFKETVDGFQLSWGVNSAEGLQQRLEGTNGTLLLVFDEFKQFVSKCRIDSSILLPCVNTLFESNRYESTTKKRHLLLENSYLSVLAASTIQTYERTWDTSFTDIGFNNRLFIVPGTAERKFSFPEKIPQNDRDEVKDQLVQILRHVGNRREIDITDGGKARYHEWYMGLERSIHAKRLDVYALRLMSLLAVNDLKDIVDLETVEHAVKLCDWQLEMRKLHDPIDADNTTAKMEEKIRRALQCGAKTERELKRAVNYQREGLWVFETAKKNLQSSQEIVWEKKAKKWGLA